jgi:hypothetical protein
VAGCIDQVELIGFPILSFIGKPNGLGFNRNSTLALKVQFVEELRLHLSRLQRASCFKNTISKRRLTVIDVGDDTKISDLISGRHNFSLLLNEGPLQGG